MASSNNRDSSRRQQHHHNSSSNSSTASSSGSTNSLLLQSFHPGLNASGDAAAQAVDLTCPVCYDTFRSPRFLPCHHTLCTECIGDLMERACTEGGGGEGVEGGKKKDYFLCPLCQLKVPVPEDGVTSFQVNFYLAPFLSGRGRSDSGPQLPKDAGGGFSKTKSQDGSPSSSFDLSCEAHWSGREWGYYCRVCTSLVCRPSCPQHQGPDHSVVHVHDEAPMHRSEVRRQLLSLTTLQGALADLEDECRHRVTALEDSCRLVEQTVTSTRQQACQVITARADKSAEKVRGLKGRISKVVEGEMKNIQEKRHSLSALLTSANDAMASSDAEFLRQKTKLMARVQSVMSKVPPSRGHLQFSFKMSPAIQSLIAKESSFGYMTVQFHSPVLRHRLTLSSTKQQRKLRKLCSRGDGSGTMLASVGNCLVTITGGSDPSESKRLEFPGEIVDFLPARDGLVYVVLPFPNAVKKLNTETDVAADFVTPLSLPTALACTDKQELVFASHDGKELCLTFYRLTSGSRLKRITLPYPELCPVVSMSVTKQGRLFLASPAEILCLDSDFSELASTSKETEGEEREGGGRGEGGGGGGSSWLEPRCLSGLRGMGSGIGDVLVANAAAGNVEIMELSGNQLKRKEEIVQWKRGTTDEDADLSKGLIPNISCVTLDTAGRLWVGQEDGHVAVYDWLLRTT